MKDLAGYELGQQVIRRTFAKIVTFVHLVNGIPDLFRLMYFPDPNRGNVSARLDDPWRRDSFNELRYFVLIDQRHKSGYIDARADGRDGHGHLVAKGLRCRTTKAWQA